MNPVFIDTAAFLALLNKSDYLYESAQKVLQALVVQKAQLITSEFVLLEVGDALSHPRFRRTVSAFVRSLHHQQNLTIVPVQVRWLDEAWQLYASRPDKEWGITDCSSFVIMREYEIPQAFTSDHHFVQAGFSKLM